MNSTPDRWPKVSSTEIADCRIFKVREDLCERERDGRRSGFFVLECPNWVNVIALTKEKDIVLVDQYRYGAEEILLEIPGGVIDGGEKPENAARRELLEETGYTSDNWVLLGKSLPNPAIQNNCTYHFLALDCQKTAETAFDEHESLVTSLKPLSEVGELVRQGTIAPSQVVCAFYYLNIWEKNL